MSDVAREVTRYGFQYGALEVERTAEAKGYVVVTLRTPYERVEVQVSPTGRKMEIRGPFKSSPRTDSTSPQPERESRTS